MDGSVDGDGVPDVRRQDEPARRPPREGFGGDG